MMVGCKYFVWGGGTWREVDTESGRVQGWRRARFVFVRGRRLHVARRRAVLRALRALAAGLPSAAADGPRLPYFKKPPPAPPAALPSPAAPTVPLAWGGFLCAHSNSCNKDLYQTNTNAHKETRVTTDAGVQCDPPTTPPRTNASNSVNFILNKQLTPHKERTEKQMTENNKSKKSKPKDNDDKSQVSSSDEAVCELTISDRDVAALRGFIARSRPEALQRFNADVSYRRALFYAINPLVSLQRSPKLEKALLSREEGALPHFAARLGLSPTPSSSSPAPVARPRRRTTNVIYTGLSSDSDTDKENHATPRRHKRMKPNDPEYTTNNHEQEREGNTRARERQLIVVKTNYDTDDKEVFKLKEGRVTRASAVGTEGVKQTSKEKGKQTSSERTKQVPTERATQTSIERAKQAPLIISDDSDKDVFETKKQSSVTAKRPRVASEQSEQDATFKRNMSVDIAPHNISKRALVPGTKEYSNLEDHAIVSWVSNGCRASLVNGNRVWQDLQLHYEALTGVYRTWHSLRNRYLRYILPALGALGLPPSHAARLRAGAATGVMGKGKKAAASTNRRASIFSKDKPIRGASSLKPKPPPETPGLEQGTRGPEAETRRTHAGPSRRSSEDADDSGLDNNFVRRSPRSGRSGRSPRYSEVTRRFAAKHPRTRSSTSTPTQSPTTSPTLPTRAHTRKLFNPNYKI